MAVAEGVRRGRLWKEMSSDKVFLERLVRTAEETKSSNA